MVVTPNPEIVLHANAHAHYRDALNAADLSLPDGFGLRMVSSLKHTVHGADMATHILTIADERTLRVALVIRPDGRSSAEQILTSVSALAPNAQIRAVEIRNTHSDSAQALKLLHDYQPQVILVGLGFPYQEQWLADNLSAIQSSRIGMAVGGTFDFWAGTVSRAPRWMQSLHVEWLWRVIQQPSRILRIARATIVFPITALVHTFHKGS